MDYSNRIQSQNKEIYYHTKASHLTGVPAYGQVMMGDKAFEFYNEKNPQDYIQIPWSEIDYISASVVMNKWINRFAIFTKTSGYFTFSTRDNKECLRQVRKKFPEERMYRSETILSTFKKSISKHFKKKDK